jgi:hypothetical protein
MDQNQQQPQMQVNLETTSPVMGKDGTQLFGQGVIIRRVSKFAIGSPEDMLMPIPVFYNLETKKVLEDSIPKEIREEYKDIILKEGIKHINMDEIK